MDYGNLTMPAADPAVASIERPTRGPLGTTDLVQSIEPRPFYTRTVDACDRMIESYLSGVETFGAIEDDVKDLQEDIDFSGEYIAGGSCKRIWPKPAIEFDPRAYWNIGATDWMMMHAEAIKEQRHVRALNADTVEENKRRALHNRHIEGMNKLRAKNERVKPLPALPLPHKMSAGNAVILKRERQANDVLRRRSPADWEYQLCRFEGGLKDAVTRILWWDWFSQRPFGKRWDELDEHLNERVRPVDKDDLADALMRCGYTPAQAWKRIG